MLGPARADRPGAGGTVPCHRDARVPGTMTERMTRTSRPRAAPPPAAQEGPEPGAEAPSAGGDGFEVVAWAVPPQNIPRGHSGGARDKSDGEGGEVDE